MTMDAYLKFSLETAMKRDGRENTIELSREVEDPKSIGDLFNSNYDDVTYKKGAAMVRMMEHFLTKKTLTQGLRTYLEAMCVRNALLITFEIIAICFKNLRAFKSVTPDDLWYHLNAQAERDGTLDPNLNVKTIMDTWTLQPGYPVIKVERDYEMRTATITQRRFFNSGIHKDMREKWWIPITWTTPNGDFENTHDVLWFKPDQDKTIIEGLPDDDTPIIVNIQVAGMYCRWRFQAQHYLQEIEHFRLL